jgi:hypothetical protein
MLFYTFLWSKFRGYSKNWGFLFITSQKFILFELNLIPNPSIPYSSSLSNFFSVKCMIENRYFSKIAPFATLPIFQYHVCNLY